MNGKVVHSSRSKLFNVIEIGSNLKSIRNFLSILHCNAYLLSFPRYNDLLV